MPPKTTTKAPKKKSGAKNNSLARPLNLKPELEAIVGKGPMSRTQIVSKIWKYIKGESSNSSGKKLQDPKDGRIIVPDAKLAKVLGSEPINMFRIGGRINLFVTKI